MTSVTVIASESHGFEPTREYFYFIILLRAMVLIMLFLFKEFLLFIQVKIVFTGPFETKHSSCLSKMCL